jgi:outer membrane protein assembly factor BamB
VSIADGLLFICDVAGRLHCLEADTGQVHWVHETNSEVWGSTLVADGKVYMPTTKGLQVLATDRKKKLISQVSVGTALYASPVAANGNLYITAKTGWVWALSLQPRETASAAN